MFLYSKLFCSSIIETNMIAIFIKQKNYKKKRKDNKGNSLIIKTKFHPLLGQKIEQITSNS